MEAKLKHLELIQLVISRLSNKSFLTKGWCVTLLAASFSINGLSPSPNLRFLSLAVVVIFFIMDTYYLSLERKFRALYKNVALKPESEIDFLMDIEAGGVDQLKTIFSRSIFIFYVPIFIGVYTFFKGLPTS